MEQWLKLAAAVLAHNAASASLVTAPRAARCRLKHIELIAISEATVLLIIVLQDGTVRQQLLIPPQQMSQDELSLIANRMTAEWGSLSAMELRATRGPLSPIESYIADNIITLMQRVGQEGGREVYRNGLVHVLSEPEFVHREAMRHVIEVLEYGSVLEEILDRVMASRGVQVIIGGEGRWNEIDECSLVMASYGVNDEAAGALGVWGPRRMSYSRAVSTVRYVAGLMSDLVQKLYGIPYPIE
jgi:heat-inducible transcriptional repressor